MRQARNNRKSNRRHSQESSIKTYSVQEGPVKLLDYLFSLFPEKSKTTVKSLLSHRQVAINNIPTTQFDDLLHSGDELAINFERGFRVFKHSRLRIVYEDEFLIVIDKGYGLL